MKKISLLLLLGSILLLSSCAKTPMDGETSKKMIFLGHTYEWGSQNTIDPRLETLNYNEYDQIWLGGDICVATSKELATLHYLDDIFDLDNPNTHWAIGNHDINNGTEEWISAVTGRENFYVSKYHDITILVLNTNLRHPQMSNPDVSRDCGLLDLQYQLVKETCDSIGDSKFLVVLHHHCLATNVLIDNYTNISNQFNLFIPDIPFDCVTQSNFTNLIYPLFKQVQEKGVQVICVGGDMGQKSKKFQYQNSDNIWFLGSGINNSVDTNFLPSYVTNINPDSVLIFDYQVDEQLLTWDFYQLNELID